MDYKKKMTINTGKKPINIKEKATNAGRKKILIEYQFQGNNCILGAPKKKRRRK